MSSGVSLMLNPRGSAPGRFRGGGLPFALLRAGSVTGVNGPPVEPDEEERLYRPGPPPEEKGRRALSVTGDVKGVAGGTRRGSFPPDADEEADEPLEYDPGSVKGAGSNGRLWLLFTALFVRDAPVLGLQPAEYPRLESLPE